MPAPSGVLSKSLARPAWVVSRRGLKEGRRRWRVSAQISRRSKRPRSGRFRLTHSMAPCGSQSKTTRRVRPDVDGPRSGLQEMLDRLEAVGGSLTVDSAPGHGTIVQGSAPIDQAVAHPLPHSRHLRSPFGRNEARIFRIQAYLRRLEAAKRPTTTRRSSYRRPRTARRCDRSSRS